MAIVALSTKRSPPRRKESISGTKRAYTTAFLSGRHHKVMETKFRNKELRKVAKEEEDKEEEA